MDQINLILYDHIIILINFHEEHYHEVNFWTQMIHAFLVIMHIMITLKQIPYFITLY
jgi:hypothetical protein